MLWNRMNRGARKVRVFCERKDPQLLRPNIRYFVAKLSIVAIYALFERTHYDRAFYESHPALGVFSTKVSLLLKGFQQKSACFRRAFGELAFVELLRERACVCVSLLTTTNCLFSRNHKSFCCKNLQIPAPRKL